MRLGSMPQTASNRMPVSHRPALSLLLPHSAEALGIGLAAPTGRTLPSGLQRGAQEPPKRRVIVGPDGMLGTLCICTRHWFNEQ